MWSRSLTMDFVGPLEAGRVSKTALKAADALRDYKRKPQLTVFHAAFNQCVCSLRAWPGVWPVQRLNAWENAPTS